ncbi:MAG: PDZ domain-containing protein [Planctomycetaceae bacterium]|jgi:serine protease Do|nr:PDZ domain-containing protein [Planctomycetaceae bacterium]
MKRICYILPLFLVVGSLVGPQSAWGAEDAQPEEPGRLERFWTRNWSLHSTNTASVKSAFQPAVSEASAATVRILADGKPAVLGVVLDDRGHVITKASELLGELSCQTGDGVDHPSVLVGVDEIHDLAVLKVDAKGLRPAVWRTGDVPPPGSLIASVAPQDELLSVGVVSSEPRAIGGPTEPEERRGWLGVGLGDGEGGLGITGVDRDSPAVKAGIRPGDRIVGIDGVAMKDYEQVIKAVGVHVPGRTIRLALRRGDKELEVTATLGKRYTYPLPQDHWGGGPFSARRSGFPSVLPHDSVVHPSECGGPLVDTDGKIVGINIARALRVTTYAIPANAVLEVSKRLLAASPTSMPVP